MGVNYHLKKGFTSSRSTAEVPLGKDSVSFKKRGFAVLFQPDNMSLEAAGGLYTHTHTINTTTWQKEASSCFMQDMNFRDLPYEHIFAVHLQNGRPHYDRSRI